MSRPPASRSPDLKALLVRAGALGDLLLLRPAIHALKRCGHSVALLAPRGPADALLGPGGAEVDRVVAWEGRAVASLLAEDRGRETPFPEPLAGFDIAVAYTGNNALVRNLGAGIPLVLSQAPFPPDGEGTHVSRWLASPLESLGLSVTEEPPVHLGSEAEDLAIAPLLDRLGTGFLAIHPGSGSGRKNWPVARFGRIAHAVAAGRPWLLVEGPADGACARPLSRVAGAIPASNLPLRVLGALLARAGVYVGNDSGVSHLAAAWGAPTVALFGPTNPVVWSPLGPRVRTVRSPDGAMESLGVAPVEAAIRDAAGLR